MNTELYNGMKVLSGYHRKGGVGKTFTVSTLAYLLASGGPLGTSPKKRVLILDFDSQQDTSKQYLPMIPVPGEDVFVAPVNPDKDSWSEIEGHTGVNYSTDILFNMDVVEYSTPIPNISILPSEGTVDRLSSISGTADVIEDKIRSHMVDWFNIPELSEDYDIIIVDNPPSKTLMATGVLQAATHIIIPTELDFDSVDGVGLLLNRINNINKARPTHPLEVLAVVANKVPSDMKRKDKTSLDMLYSPDGPTREHMAPFFLKNRQCYRPERKPTTSEVDFSYVRNHYAIKEMFALYAFTIKKLWNEDIKIPKDYK
jgi:chromosome partitioning protein